MVVGTRRRARARERVPEQHGILTRGDALGGVGAAVEGEPEGGRSEAAGQGPDESLGLQGDELDVGGHVEAGLVWILVAAGNPPAAASTREEERGEEGPQRAEDVLPADDDEVECTGGQEAPNGGRAQLRWQRGRSPKQVGWTPASTGQRGGA